MAYLTAAAQKGNDSTVYKKQSISRTDIQALFSYYTQDGNHSAVTGGTGTEALQVFVSDITVTRKRDSITTLQLNAGVDVITSASTDNIDFVLSSASRDDRRFHIMGGYNRQLKKPHIRAGINLGLSLESDYLSIPIGISVSHDNATHSRQLTASLQCYFDDLRWGRFDPDYYKPETLVYPEELRYKEWFDIYRRQSYNLSFALYQVVNKRMQFAIYPELVYQKGLLSTPFHRVYFKDANTLKVENLPRERWKVPLTVQLNTFIDGQVILRTYYSFYHDNFGITAHALQLELPVKTSPLFTLSPLVRLYTQKASRYFQPFQGHDLSDEYYTSDYDLSSFNSYKLGITARYALFKPIFRNSAFQEIGLRYSFYKRTDQLSAHMLSLLLDFRHTR
ncbi:Protein of unknown function [Chitinophaga sp. CF118]|nr:Protein of unknown function [Chitinophaga sp. CF118]